MTLEHRWSQRRMSDYVDGEMSPRQQRRLERHAAVCPECGPLRRALRWLVIELQELRWRPSSSVAPAVVARLRAATITADGPVEDRPDAR